MKGLKTIKKVSTLLVLSVIIILVGCQSENTKENSNKLQVVATTTMLADLATVIGNEYVEVNGLMGPGIDPHLYKASAGDVELMQKADLIVYNGLHLEGKMGEIFENFRRGDKLIVEIAHGINEEALIMDAGTNAHDPHIWFNVLLWKEAAKNLAEGLKKLDPENANAYDTNYETYAKALEELDAYVKEQVGQLPETSRVLVTAHDAFAYFGEAYGFEVLGLQGISTSSEAGTGDVKELADYIVAHKIKAIFVESSVPKKNVEALQEAVQARGFEVAIGGELFSDSLGSKDTEEATYIGTVKHNVDTIVNALK